MGKGKKKGKKFSKFVESQPQSGTSTQINREASNKTDVTIHSGNTDSGSVELSVAAATNNILDSSGDISRISDSTKDESTDVSSRLDESPSSKDGKQDSSNSWRSEMNYKHCEPENVKNRIQNLSVNCQPAEEHFHKNNARFENRGRNNQFRNDSRGFMNEKQKGGRGVYKQQRTPNFQQETRGRNNTGTGESQGEFQGYQQQKAAWDRYDSESVQKPKEHISRNYSKTDNSYANPSVRGEDDSYRHGGPYEKKNNNTHRFTNTSGRQKETTNQVNSYKDKGGHNNKSEISNFGTRLGADVPNEIQKSRNAVYDNSVQTYKDGGHNILLSENWDDECNNGNSNNRQDLAREVTRNPDHSQRKTLDASDSDSIQQPREQILCNYTSMKPSVPGEDESYRRQGRLQEKRNTNTCQITNRSDRRNEMTSQGNFYKGRGANYDQSTGFKERSNFETRPRTDMPTGKQRTWVPVHNESVDSAHAHNVENSEPNVSTKEEDWDREIGDIDNLNNQQDLVEENSNQASDKCADEYTDDSLKSTSSTDYYENKFPQKNKAANNNWRKDGNNSFPTMAAHHQDASKRYSEGNRGNRSKGDWSKSYSESTDPEFKAFWDEERKTQKVEFVKVEEIQQDLFAMPKDYSLGHCVAEDLRMGSGIAVSFKREFKQLGDLLDQRQKQGGLAVLEDENKEGTRYVYYLITKRESTGKPTYDKFWSSLQRMRDHIRDNNVKKLAIPRLGCGLDRLEWSKVKHMIEFLFREVDAKITVCNFQQTEESLEKQLNYTCKVVNVAKSIAAIEDYTTIIYLSTVDGHVSEEMNQLDKKFNFLNEFKNARKQLGDLVKYESRNQVYTLYGCIVRKSNKDPFQFNSFEKCILQINKNNRKDKYDFVGLQAFVDETDDLLMEKILTIMKNYLVKVDIYVCWHGDLVKLMPISYRESL